MPVTNYIYDPVTEAYLMEQDGDGNTTVVYTQEPVKYGDVIAQHRIDPTTGVGESFYYHPDALGSTRELTDTNGEVVATYNYDAFGNTIASTGTVENPFRFTGNVGYYWDEELQTYHIRARNYQPTTGRWTNQDPIGFAGGINLYGAYFVPNETDPSGMRPLATASLPCNSDNHCCKGTHCSFAIHFITHGRDNPALLIFRDPPAPAGMRSDPFDERPIPKDTCFGDFGRASDGNSRMVVTLLSGEKCVLNQGEFPEGGALPNLSDECKNAITIDVKRRLGEIPSQPGWEIVFDRSKVESIQMQFRIEIYCGCGGVNDLGVPNDRSSGMLDVNFTYPQPGHRGAIQK